MKRFLPLIVSLWVLNVAFAAPEILFSTYLGGEGDDAAVAIKVDPSGHPIVLVRTSDALFGGGVIQYVAPPAFGQGPFFDYRGADLLLVKYSPDFSGVDYMVVVGGHGEDIPLGLAVDAQGNAIVLAHTMSDDFPLKNPIQGQLRGTSDAVVFKVSPSGRELLFSTYLGGSDDEFAPGFGSIEGKGAVDLDASGNIGIAGETFSNDFPTTPGAYHQEGGTGLGDGFIALLSANGERLIYSATLGGQQEDRIQALVFDNDGRAWVGGGTASTNFPLVQPLNALRSTSANIEPFIARLSIDGKALEWSSLLIGRGEINAMAFAPDGGLAIGGQTTGGISTTVGSLQQSTEGARVGFAAKFDPAVSKITYATYVGGRNDVVNGLAFDEASNLFITGSVSSSAFPIINAPALENPFQASSQDAFLIQVSPNGQTAFATRIGGLRDDSGRAVTLSPDGDALLVGVTGSFEFPLVKQLKDFPERDDAFVARVHYEAVGEHDGNQTADGALEAKRFVDRVASPSTKRFYRARLLDQ